MSIPLHGIYPVTYRGAIVVAGGGLVPGYGAGDVVISLARLPDSALRYGVPTPGCSLAPLQGLDRRPRAGDALFGFLCGPGAPSGAAGALLVGLGGDVPGQMLLGVRVHLDLRFPIAVVPVLAAPIGATRAPVPLPPGSAGAFGYTQFVFLPAGGCARLTASDAIVVRVQ
jgi:hypothetical protein